MNTTLFNPYLFWEEDYTLLEDEFIEFLKYIPLSKEHEEVWSMKLANLLLLIGSSVESFFQCAISSLRASEIYNYIDVNDYGGRVGYTPEDFESLSELNKLLLKKLTPNMGLYRDIFEKYYHLSNKSVFVLRNKEEIKPFKEWGENKPPEWWITYRNLKHSRFKHRKSAQLKMVLNTLASLFLLNISHKDTRKYLTNKGVIRSNMKLGGLFYSAREPGSFGQPIIAKTNIFGYIFDSGYWNPWDILDPGNVYGL